MQPKTWVEIDASNLKYNVKQFRSVLGRDVQYMAVVKSNAYGHGLVPVVQALTDVVDWFGVDSLEEALAVREAGSERPVLILGYTLEENLKQVLTHGFSQVIANRETLRVFGELTKRTNRVGRIHLKIETGMSRQGVFVDDLDEYVTLLQEYPLLILEGVSTHFAKIEDSTDHFHASLQLKHYHEALNYFKDKGISVPLRHIASSAAAILFPKTYFSLVRIGLSTYGMWSSLATIASAQSLDRSIVLKPALTWKTRVAHVKTVPAGSCISYGCTETVEHPTKVAVLPVGYWDGFDRKLSRIGAVLIQGTRCKVMGRVCMNMIIVSVDHLDEVSLEEEVILLGRQGENEITAEEFAQKCGTINYEIATRINPLIPRVIIT